VSELASSLGPRGQVRHAPAVKPDEADAAARRGHMLLVAALGVGTLLRLVHYAARPSLLIDEARVALDVGSRDWVGLLRPLDYDQTAPILFLWAERLATRLAGVNEHALRALPFLAGIAALPLLLLIARRLLGVVAATLAVSIAAVSPQLIQYSGEVKPYSLDLAITLGLVWLALEVRDAPQNIARRRRLALGGLLAIWASAPAAFTLAAIGGALMVAPPKARLRYRFVLGTSCLWAASFALAYAIVYAPAAKSPYMREFWQGSLLRILEPGLTARAWHGIRETVWQLFVGGTTDPPLGRPESLLATIGAAALVLVGLAGARRIQRAAGWDGLLVTIGPFLAGVAASLVGGYPVAARVMTYAATSLVLPVAGGCIALAESMGATPRGALALVSACVLVSPLPRDIALATRPNGLENVRAAVSEFERLARPGEPIYVFAATLPAWTFYTTDWTAPDTVRLARMARLGSSGGPAFENAPPRRRAIRDEGDSLVYQYGGRPEIIGLFHGAQWRSATGPVQHHADTNWTTNEARRIRAAALPEAWVLVSHSHALERFLVPAVEALGGHVVESYKADGARLWKFRFAPDPLR